MLDLSQGFTIAFAECNFWQDGVALVESLKEEIASDPEWEELQLEAWEFNDPDLRYLLDELIKRLETLPRQEGKKLVLVLSGLENAIGVVGEYPPFLVDLNFVRDAYARMVPHPVVFVLPDYAITRVANFAPDFWAWKSSVFKFKTSREARDFAEAKTIGSDRILGNYLKPEKQERIELLHRLLMEANPSGSDSESNPNSSSQINILNELGSGYYSLSEYNRAIDFFQQALVLSQKLADRKGEANSLNRLGNAYDSLGQYQQAIQFQQQSLEIYREIGDRNGEAKSLGNLGLAYSLLGQYQQAIQFQQQSLEIKREIGDLNGEANSLCNLGGAYDSLGQYQQAIQFQQQSLVIYREIGDRNGEASSLGNLGLAYYSLGQYQQAIQFQQQSLVIYREIGDRNGEANSLNNLGLAYYSLGQYQQAIQFQQQSLEIFREIGDRNGEAISLNNLGLALKALGRRSESIEAFNASRKIYEELGLYHKIKNSDKSFAPLETIAKEPKRFELPDPPKRKRRKNLFQIIFVWLRRIWSKLWRRDQ
ncbi:MAG: tetratricopeptide repeat protein [Pseudanabaena sp. M109S1SP2A07QC]|nr:tetratricopeptide repeat protein [Pseudanabaena sp. M109S1SP2A07QC]